MLQSSQSAPLKKLNAKNSCDYGQPSMRDSLGRKPQPAHGGNYERCTNWKS
jgi:hypothetical protein